MLELGYKVGITRREGMRRTPLVWGLSKWWPLDAKS